MKRKSFFFLITIFEFATASHFRGGSISWRPISDNNSTVTVEFRAYWSWRRSFSSQTFCNATTISSGVLMGINENIVCRIGCAKAGDIIGTTLMKCIAFDANEDWLRGESIFNYTIPKTSDYEASYIGSAWIGLNSGGGNWEVRTMLDVTNRNDTGKINTSPITQVPLYIKMRKGFNYGYTIPTYDADGDFVRCRYANSSKGECSGACLNTALVPIQLNPYTCELTFDSAQALVGYYVLPLVIEDYLTNSSTKAMSAVPIQVVVQIVNVNSNCTKP